HGWRLLDVVAMKIFDPEILDRRLDVNQRTLRGAGLRAEVVRHFSHRDVAQRHVANSSAAGWKAPAVHVDRVKTATAHDVTDHNVFERRLAAQQPHERESARGPQML